MVSIACNNEKDIPTNGADDITVSTIHSFIVAGTPSDNEAETKVVIEGDSPSEPIQVMWRGSSDSFREQFALVVYEDGNLWKYPATRSLSEVADAVKGVFEFDIENYGRFYALYPYKDPDRIYMSGNDNDKANWVYRLDGQTGWFRDLHNFDFMTGIAPVNITSESSDPIQFKHEVAILRLSSLKLTDLASKTISGLVLKSNAIADAASYSEYFSPYYEASTEISLSGSFYVDSDGVIDENIYIAFFPSGEQMDYFTLTLDVEGDSYVYEYDGSIKSFTKGKVYTLKDAQMVKRPDSTPSYGWYTSPVSSSAFELSSINDFVGFAKLVNGDSEALKKVGESSAIDFEGKTVRVAAALSTIDLKDILLPGESWTPIDGFKGTFDGNSVDIINLYNDALISSPYGLFGSVQNATIKNVNVSGTIDCNLRFNQRIGGIVGYASNSVIQDCSSSVSLNIGKAYGRSIGGICGRLDSGSSIIGCISTSTIVVNTDTDEKDYCGGIAGIACDYCNIIASTYKGSIKSYQKSMVGGISGYMWTSSRVSACYAKATVSGYYPGFIISTREISYPGTVTNCYYEGSGTSAGIGCTNGRPYEYNTARVTDVAEAVSSMNESITTWNTENPSTPCTRQYCVESGSIVLR